MHACNNLYMEVLVLHRLHICALPIKFCEVVESRAKCWVPCNPHACELCTTSWGSQAPQASAALLN